MTSIEYRLTRCRPRDPRRARSPGARMTRRRSWGWSGPSSRMHRRSSHRDHPAAGTASPWIPAKSRHTDRDVGGLRHGMPADTAEARVRGDHSFGSPIGRHRPAPHVRIAAEPAGHDPAQGPSLLLEVGVLCGAPTSELMGYLKRSARGLQIAATRASPCSPSGGDHQRLPSDHSAVGNRDAGLVLNIGGLMGARRGRRQELKWARAVWQGARRFSTGGVYVNFLTEDEGEDRIQAVVRRQPRSPYTGEDGLGSRQRVPSQQEHRANGLNRHRSRGSTMGRSGRGERI